MCVCAYKEFKLRFYYARCIICIDDAFKRAAKNRRLSSANRLFQPIHEQLQGFMIQHMSVQVMQLLHREGPDDKGLRSGLTYTAALTRVRYINLLSYLQPSAND